MNIQSIPLTKLAPSPLNVRKTGKNIAIDELAASIAAHGLLQNLQVRRKNGIYEVVAGGRRLAALQLLAKQKRLPKAAKVPCNVLEDEDGREISLAENVVRLPMHPADQFDAFKKLVDEGKGEEEIAARFGCAASTVSQRLKMARISPALIKAYRRDNLTLDQLMAFTVSEDHAAQEACWQSLPEWNRDPAIIRRTLMAEHVDADDKRVRFVGIDSYANAGGQVVRDLFQARHQGWLTDAGLLDRLVAERLEQEAETLRGQGWKWVAIHPDLDWETLRAFERIQPDRQELPRKQQKAMEALAEEHDRLAEEDEEANAHRLAEISARIEALQASTLAFAPDQIASSGVVVGIGQDGALEVERGLLRQEDRRALHADGASDESEISTVQKASPTLSASLVEELTAHRTAALRVMLADNPQIALAACVHALALPMFYSVYDETCIGIRGKDTDLCRCGATLEDSIALTRLTARQQEWSARLPTDPAELWPWLMQQDGESLTGLLALCVALCTNAVQRPHDRSASRLGDADKVASILGLNMAEWWKPTAATYLSRVSKARILEAVAGGCSKQAAENLGTLKKGALVARAEELLADKNWLPQILRPSEGC